MNQNNSKKCLCFFIGVFICIYLIYGFLLVFYSNDGFPKGMHEDVYFPYLNDKPLGEDGYYIFTVAWNFAEGKGLTYNFDLPTTGIQPLITLILAGIASIVRSFGGDKWVFVRFILLFEIISFLIYAILISCITNKIFKLLGTQKQRLTIISVCTIIFNYGLFRIFTYGLETSIVLILYSYLIYFSFSINLNDNYFHAFLFGLLAGCTILARIDFVIVLSIFCFISIIRKQTTYKWILISTSCSLLVVLPWFMYILRITGGLIPSSGISQFKLITFPEFFDRLWNLARALVRHLIPWIYSRPCNFLSLLAMVFFVVVTTILVKKPRIYKQLKSFFVKDDLFLNWTIGIFSIVIIYPILFRSTHFFTRYISPVTLIYFPLLTILLYTISDKLRLWVIITGQVIQLLIFLGWAFFSLHTGSITNTQPIVAGYINHEFPQDIKIGSFQSGVVGYFNENVVNLDGKIDHRVNLYLETNTMDKFIDLEGIDVIIDWQDIIFKYLPSQYLEENWELCPNPIPDNRSLCLIRMKFNR